MRSLSWLAWPIPLSTRLGRRFFCFELGEIGVGQAGQDVARFDQVGNFDLVFVGCRHDRP